MDGRKDGRTTDATPWHKLIGPFGPDELKMANCCVQLGLGYPPGGVTQNYCWYPCLSKKTSKKGLFSDLRRRRRLREKGLFFNNTFRATKSGPRIVKKGGYFTFHPEISLKKGVGFLSLSLWTPEKFK